jgi:hypothetical protein
MSTKQVSVWCTAFQSGRVDLNNEPRPGRRRSAVSDDMCRVTLLSRTSKDARRCDHARRQCCTTHRPADPTVPPALWVGGVVASRTRFRLCTLRH